MNPSCRLNTFMAFIIFYLLTAVGAFNEPIFDAVLTVIFPINLLDTISAKIFLSATSTSVGLFRLYRRTAAKAALS